MKTFSYAMILLLCFAFPARAVNVYTGCAAPPATPRNIWYVDPVNGKTPADGGLGTQAAPWNSLLGILAGEWGTAGYSVDGYTRPLLSTVPYFHSVANSAGQRTFADNVGSPPIQPGDEILLMSGNYGDISIGVYEYETANPEFVTVAAAPGQTPVLSTLWIYATTNWLFDGLTVQSTLTSSNSNPLIYVKDQGASFPTANIIFENMELSSTTDASSWSQAQWVANARSGFFAYSSAGGTDTSCISFTGSHISNVRFGAVLAANKLLFSNNQIDHFGDDGIDYGATNLAITKNNIHDNLDVGDGNHEDAMQGVLGVLAPGATLNYFQNILIDSNLIIRQTDPELAFPTYLQGIDAFDSDWTNVTVSNNVVITSACWGIAFSSIHNGLIVNNTVVEDGLVATPGCAANVAVGDTTHEGAPSSNTAVRNNLTSQLTIYNVNNGVEADHNVTMLGFEPQISWYVSGVAQNLGNPGPQANANIIGSGGPTSEFADFNPSTLTYDVLLKSGAQAIAAGTGTGAPAVDIAGVPRSGPSYTAGAYSYPY